MMSFLYNEFFGLEIIDWIILLMLFYIYGRTTTISNQIARVHIDVNHERDKERLENFTRDNHLNDTNLDEAPEVENKKDDKKKTESSFIGKVFKYLFWFFLAFITVGAIVSSL